MINEALQVARKNAGMTQEAVAGKLYVTRQTISRWEQGKTLPNIYALKDLAALYQVSLDDLIAATKTEAKAEGTMSKINWASLFGLFWFNLIVTLSVVLLVAGLLVGAWASVIAFILSPVLAAGQLVASHWFVIDSGILPLWGQIGGALLLCAGGLLLWPRLLQLTRYLWRRFKQYLRYNVRAVYH
ncbi:helix-turn-helix transcriptional regulator [Lacticaseibacillus mingshuiensis]|uniref:helix-turn-helix transcriptional regulator n=1 Tax=Lacticaseibacillus mingshuiensis TaxID=2799574 RepID=UPI001950E049|nr:helix-turn-helix transcriptional regulator [Lacticaseibacillus mingshuiensis]